MFGHKLYNVSFVCEMNIDMRCSTPPPTLAPLCYAFNVYQSVSGIGRAKCQLQQFEIVIFCCILRVDEVTTFKLAGGNLKYRLLIEIVCLAILNLIPKLRPLACLLPIVSITENKHQYILNLPNARKRWFIFVLIAYPREL